MCIGGALPDPTKSYSVISLDDIKNAKDLRVFIANGKQDRSYSEGIKASDTLKSHGYAVSFFGYEGGHVIPPVVLEQAVLWMKGK